MRNMQSFFHILVVSSLVATGIAQQETKTEGKPKEDTSKKLTDSKDIFTPVDLMKDFKHLNSDKFKTPPTKFKAGHIKQIAKPKPKVLDEKKIPKTSFTVQVSSSPLATPTFYKDKIYTSGGFSSKKFFCFDAKTGKTIWGVDLDDDGPSASSIEDDILTFNTESCTLFALDAKTGKHLWSHWLGDPLMSSPAVKNGFVYSSYPSTTHAPKNQKTPLGKHIKKLSHVIACFELKTGKIVWQKWIDSDVMTAPVIMKDGLHLTTFGGNYYKLNLTTGAPIEAKKVRATSAPLVVNGKIAFAKRADKAGKVREAFVMNDAKLKVLAKGNDKNAAYLDQKVQAKTGEAKKAAALDASNGFADGAPATANVQVAYSNIGIGNVSNLQQFQGSRGVAWGGFCMSCMGDEIVSINQKNGDVEWRVELKGDLKKLGGFLASSPALANGDLVVGTVTGKVLVLDAEKGKIKQEFDAKSPIRSQLIFNEGVIYVGTQCGKILAFDTGDKKLTGWTTLGADAARTGSVTSK